MFKNIHVFFSGFGWLVSPISLTERTSAVIFTALNSQFSAPHLRSCRFIAVTRACLKVPAKNLPLVEEKRTSWLIPFLSTHTVKLMEMEHAMDA